MKIKALKQLIQDIPDETELLIPGIDHNFYSAYAEYTTALKQKREWNEDFGEDATPEAEWGKRTPVVVVRA